MGKPRGCCPSGYAVGQRARPAIPAFLRELVVMSVEPIRIIYDTDLGEDIDDLYALYLALFHPRIEVLAVTTVHGDTRSMSCSLLLA